MSISNTELSSRPGSGLIEVLLVDHHAIVRAALRMLIDKEPGLTVVGEAGNYTDAVAVTSHMQPHIILLELLVASESGLDYIRELLTVSRRSRVLVLTAVMEVEQHLSALQLGARGLVFKDSSPEMLIKAINKVHAGEAWLRRTTFSELLAEVARSGKEKPENLKAASIAGLTKREGEIITNVALGYKNKKIAALLCISDVTVRHHLTSIYDKLQVADRFELIIYAFRHGLADHPGQ